MLIRYPGGKQKLAAPITDWLKRRCIEEDITEYREPFFGAGAIGFRILHDPELEQIKRAWINDKDAGICSLWSSVLKNPERLIKKIVDFEKAANFEPAPKGNSTHRSSKEATEKFHEWQEELRNLVEFPENESEQIKYGFKKLACHQMSYSGLGTMGGPIGGKHQTSKGRTAPYGIGCRYSPATLKKNVELAHKILTRVDLRKDICTCLGFEDVFSNTDNCIFYVDPPYYVQGGKLYQCGFTPDDHARLAEVLKKQERPWLLSYDVCPQIKDLYSGSDKIRIEKVPLTYSVNWHGRMVQLDIKAKDKWEYIISNRSLDDFDLTKLAKKKKEKVQQAEELEVL